MGMDTLASRINTVIILVLVICWCGELFAPHGWHQKVTLLYEIDVGLMSVGITHGVALKAMDLALRGLTPGAAEALANVVVGEYSVMEASDYLCGVSQSFAPGVNGCEIWSQINTASRIMQCMIITGIILLILGGAFHYHYWFISPRKKTRMWTRGFLIGAPAIIMTGFLIYYAMTKNLANFPPRGTMTFGYCYIFGIWLCIWTCVPVFVHEQFAQQSSSEVMIEETKKAQKHFQSYGAAQQHAGFVMQQQYAPQTGYEPQPQYAPNLQYAPQPQYAPQAQHTLQAGGGVPGIQPWVTETGYGYEGPMAFDGAAYGAAPDKHGALPSVPMSSSGALRTSSTRQAQVSSGALRTSSTSQAHMPVSPSGGVAGGGVSADAPVANLAAQHETGSASSGAMDTSERAPAVPGADKAESSSNSSNDGSDSTGSGEAGGDRPATPVDAVVAGEVTATPASEVGHATTTVDGQEPQR